jgi:integrase
VRGGRHYRIGLDREIGRHVESKSEAETEAARIRIAIDEGTFRSTQETASVAGAPLTFRSFADIWMERRGRQLVSGPIDVYRLKTICAFVLLSTGCSFGDKAVEQITVDDIETFRDARRSKGLSAVSINHDLRLLRKMFNWAVRKEYLARSPFKIGSEPAISLEREIPRHKRFESPDIEEKLLEASDPYLRGVITAMLDTACRPGEILSLQWQNVSLERRELTIRAEKEKTRRERVIPISSRLMAILEMRRHDPAGRQLSPQAYVLGDELGKRRPLKRVGEAWTKAAAKAGLTDFQLRDLRHEAGSRFDEAGVPIVYVSNMLGHSNLSTTSRYLNINRRGLHLAMQKFEESRRASTEENLRASKVDDKRTSPQPVAHALHTADESALAVVPEPCQINPAKVLPS